MTGLFTPAANNRIAIGNYTANWA